VPYASISWTIAPVAYRPAWCHTPRWQPPTEHKGLAKKCYVNLGSRRIVFSFRLHTLFPYSVIHTPAFDIKKLLNPKQPKVFGLKLSLREIGGIFSFTVRNFKLWKMPQLLNFGFPEGWYFFKCDNTKLKTSSKINVSGSQRHHWAVVV